MDTTTTPPGAGKSKAIKIFLIGGGLLLLGMFVLGLIVCAAAIILDPVVAKPAADAPRVGTPAPDFSLVDAVSGETVTLSQFQGQPVLVNFWATWCGPCRAEMPYIQAAYERHQPDLVVLAVNFDESASLVAAFGQELGLTFNLLLDPGGQIQSLYRVYAYPTTYYIDRDGTIASVQIGDMDEDVLVARLETIIQ